MTNQYPVEIDGATGEIEPLPPQRSKRYRCRLDSLQDVRAEMSKIYRECRSGIIEPSDGTKLTFMLKEIARVIEGSDLEKRIEVLEKR